MPDHIADIRPPEDKGSDTYRRFRVQAAVAMPYVVGLITGQIAKVIMEHIDDFVVIRSDGAIELHQVKTRTTTGSWTLHQLAEQGTYGRPLYVMFRKFLLVRLLSTRHVLHLQGRMDGECAALANACATAMIEPYVAPLATLWGAPATEVREFLLRLSIRDGVPPSDVIDIVSAVRCVGPFVRLDTAGAQKVYNSIVDVIGHAMEATMSAGPAEWIKAELEGRPQPSDVVRKSITVLELADFAARFTTEGRRRSPVRRDEIGGGTDLAEKFGRGGADPGLLDHVKELRAIAYTRQVEQLTGGPEIEAEIEDVRRHIQTRIFQVLGEFSDRPAPAYAVFSRLATLTQGQSEQIDKAAVFDADPDLLLGVALQMCDECVWSLD
jgi:Cap4-like dsDNA endonuclease family protein